MPSVLREILIIFLLMLANGVFAMSEAAVMSARRARLQERANRGDARAQVALELANAPNTFLSTTQIGITLISILAGAFGGQTLTSEIAAWLRRTAVAPYAHTVAMVLVVGGITFISLVIGELVPKRLALNNPEGTASRIAGPMRRLSSIAAPIVSILSFTTDLLLRLLGSRHSGEPPVTEEEVKILLEQGAEAGVFLATEQQMVQSVFRLTDRRVSELTTPRLKTVWLDVNDPLEENLRIMEESGFSRFPVGEDSLDRFLGMVSVKVVWRRMMSGQPVDLRSLLWQPPVLPETMGALHALDVFRHTGRQIALVVDEYGGVQGILTLMDVLEAIVGEVAAAPGATSQQAVRRPDGSWLLDGMLLVDEVKDILAIQHLPDENSGDYETLGGFVMTQLQHLPATGDSFVWNHRRWEVVDMDGNRVDKVLVASDDGASSDGAPAEPVKLHQPPTSA